MRKYFSMYEEAVSHIWLCNLSLLNFLIYEENLIFFFIRVGPPRKNLSKRSTGRKDCCPLKVEGYAQTWEGGVSECWRGEDWWGTRRSYGVFCHLQGRDHHRLGSVVPVIRVIIRHNLFLGSKKTKMTLLFAGVVAIGSTPNPLPANTAKIAT